MNDEKTNIADLEQLAKAGKPIPDANQYKIRIDKNHYIVDVPEMTGLALLKLASKNPPERFALYQKLHGGRTQKIQIDELVDFRTPGVERFMTLPLDQTEGESVACEKKDFNTKFYHPSKYQKLHVHPYQWKLDFFQIPDYQRPRWHKQFGLLVWSRI